MPSVQPIMWGNTMVVDSFPSIPPLSICLDCSAGALLAGVLPPSSPPSSSAGQHQAAPSQWPGQPHGPPVLLQTTGSGHQDSRSCGLGAAGRKVTTPGIQILQCHGYCGVEESQMVGKGGGGAGCTPWGVGREERKGMGGMEQTRSRRSWNPAHHPTRRCANEPQLRLLSQANDCAPQEEAEKCGNQYRSITGRCNNEWVLQWHLTWEGVGSARRSFPTLLTPTHPLLQEETLAGGLQPAPGVLAASRERGQAVSPLRLDPGKTCNSLPLPIVSRD